MAKRVFAGLSLQEDVKSIIYVKNELGPLSLKFLDTILLKPIPYHLEELRIVNCKISP